MATNERSAVEARTDGETDARDLQEGEDGDADRDWSAVEDLPPSAKLVAVVLDRRAPLTQSELADETLLSPRTVRYAVSRLEEVDAIDARVSFVDARKRRYSLDLD